MVEQGTHKPLDVGSNPTLATNLHPDPKRGENGIFLPPKTCFTQVFAFNTPHWLFFGILEK